MRTLAKHVSSRATPQSQPIPGRCQEQNNAGGYSYVLDCWKRLERFLILGSGGGTYYVGERQLTADNAAVVVECGKADVARTVETIASISEAGRAPKNDPAIFALALLASHEDDSARRLALATMPRVCRTATHLFQFVANCKELRGWGVDCARPSLAGTTTSRWTNWPTRSRNTATGLATHIETCCG